MLLTKAPNWNVNESLAAPERSKVRGNNGTRIVFSWTWKEKRKKDMDEVNNA